MAALLAVPAAADDAPLPFTPPVEARPVEPVDSSTSLRWRASTSIASVHASTAAISGNSHDTAVSPDGQFEPRGSWNVTRIDPSIRPAQAVSDPFADPFGDRQALHAERDQALRPTAAEAEIEELPPPQNAVRLNSPANQYHFAQQPSVDTYPRFDTAPGADPQGTPCDRIYNDRNCCDVDIACREFRNRLIADSIRNISLDITPRYSPDLTPEEDAAQRAERFRVLESRAWRNRQGAVVATGRMANLVSDAVVVVDDTGREVGRIPLRQLGDDELCFVTAWWRLPAECTLGGINFVRREWIPSTYAWHASALCHKPLYFEQPQLERYGHTTGPFTQPVVSGAHFFLNIATLPYQMAISPPHECEYALGYYRPGSCAPKMIRPIPLSLRGAAAQTGAVLGGVFLLP